jgi:hypothetical protein
MQPDAFARLGKSFSHSDHEVVIDVGVCVCDGDTNTSQEHGTSIGLLETLGLAKNGQV